MWNNQSTLLAQSPNHHLAHTEHSLTIIGSVAASLRISIASCTFLLAVVLIHVGAACVFPSLLCTVVIKINLSTSYGCPRCSSYRLYPCTGNSGGWASHHTHLQRAMRSTPRSADKSQTQTRHTLRMHAGLGCAAGMLEQVAPPHSNERGTTSSNRQRARVNEMHAREGMPCFTLATGST